MQRFESHRRLQELNILPSREERDQKNLSQSDLLIRLHVVSAIHKVKEVINFVTMKNSGGYCEPDCYWLHHLFTLIGLEQHQIILKEIHL